MNNPLYRAIKEPFHTWFLDRAPYTSSRQRERLKQTDYPLLASMSWHSADARRMWDIAAISAALVERDDEWDFNRQEISCHAIQNSIDDLLSGYTTLADLRWSPLFAEIWNNYANYLPDDQMQALTHGVAAYLEGCISFEQQLNRNSAFASTEDYFHARSMSIGHHIDRLMVEISLEINLGDKREDPQLLELAHRDTRRVIVYQDFLSLRKELYSENAKENIVMILARSQRCSINEAIHKTIDLFTAEMTAFDQAVEQIKNTPLGRHPDVTSYITGLEDFTSGLIEWTSHSLRYTTSY